MIVVLVHWKVKPGREEAFRTYWQSTATLQNDDGLIGEFLTQEAPVLPPFDQFPAAEQGCSNFYNFGLWNDEGSFVSAVAPHFNQDGPPLPFEWRRRSRHLFRPTAWRRGMAELPAINSTWTF